MRDKIPRMESLMRFLSAIVLTLFLSLSAAVAAPPPDGWIKKLEDGGFLIKDKPIIISFCKQPLLMVIATEEGGAISVYDGPAMKDKARKVVRGQYLTFNVAPIMGVDCSAPQEHQKPKRKKFFRVLSQ